MTSDCRSENRSSILLLGAVIAGRLTAGRLALNQLMKVRILPREPPFGDRLEAGRQTLTLVT